MKRRARFRSALLGTLLLVSQAALAAPNETEKEHARLLMDEGDSLVEKKNYSEALAKYRQAHEIMHVTTTGIEVARTLAALGRLVEAKRAAHEAAGIPPAPGEPRAFTAARKDAASLAQELDARVPQVTITLSGVPAGTSVSLTIDGEKVASPEIEQPQDLDPGAHGISAEAGAMKTTARVVLKEGERQTVTLSFGSVTSTKEQSNGAASSSQSPVLGYVIGGIGIAGLAVFGVTSVIFIKNNQDIKDECPQKDQCTQSGIDKIDQQKTLGTINLISLGVGAIGTGVGAYLILSNRSSKEKTSLSPIWMKGGASISLQRSF